MFSDKNGRYVTGGSRKEATVADREREGKKAVGDGGNWGLSSDSAPY